MSAMTTRPKALVSWSSGKDSAWTLHLLRQQGRYDIRGLLTTVNQRYDRVAMHAVRAELLRAQAAAAGLPLWEVPLPDPCSNLEYEAAMRTVVARARDDGISVMAFGDLYLADIRAYREAQLAGTGIDPVFPLWLQPTGALANQMIAGGVQATVTCVDPRKAPAVLAGRRFDGSLLAELPAGVDPCGENGEFHTFVHAGPMFAAPIRVSVGEVVQRDGFVFADVVPVEKAVGNVT
jgi:uncharacterized protein (TIGR00290 family)